jgi:predicted amidophosphoribosyltransferase
MQASDEATGRCIIILDDVSTSGATFTEAKRALKQAGAKKILCVAVAH